MYESAGTDCMDINMWNHRPKLMGNVDEYGRE